MKRVCLVMSVLVLVSTVLIACGPTPEPEVVEVEKVVEKEVEKVVTQVAEVVVSPTAELAVGGPHQGGEIFMADMEPNTMNPYIASEAIALALDGIWQSEVWQPRDRR